MGVNFLDLPGPSGANASVPDSAALDITGDLELIVRAAADDWSAADSGVLLAKWTNTERSYRFYVSSTGTLTLAWSTDGTSGTTIFEGQGDPGFTNGRPTWLRMTLDVDDGASNYLLTWYWSEDDTNDPDAVSWTQFGTDSGAATTSIHSGTAALEVGTLDTADDQFIGKIYRARVISDPFGAAVIELDPDFTTAPVGAEFFVEDSVNAATVTVNSPGAISTIYTAAAGLGIIPELLVDWAGDGFQVATVEGGTVTRIAGPFTNFLAADFDASNDVVTLDNALIGLDETLGCALVCWDATASGVVGGNNAHLFDWGVDNDDRIDVFYRANTQDLRVTREAANSNGTQTIAQTLTAGVKRIDGMTWSATGFRLIGAATLSSPETADTNIPTLNDDLNFGNRLPQQDAELEGAISWAMTLNREPTQAELTELDALNRPPLFGEIFGRAMTSLWLGQDQLYYDDADDIVTPEMTRVSTTVGDRTGLPQIRSGRPGKLAAELRNHSGRYSPSNTSSPLTGLILEGRDVRLRIASTGNHHSTWYGRLDEPARPRWERHRLTTTRLEASGMLRQLIPHRAVLADQIAQDTGAIMTALFTAAPDLAPLIGSFDTGASELAVFFPGNEDTVRQVTKVLEQNELGWLRETRAGLLDYENRHYRGTGARLVSSATISDALAADLTQSAIIEEQPGQSKVNSSVVAVRQFDTPEDSAILWSYAGAAIEIAPGASTVIVATWPSRITSRNAGYVSTWETILESDMTLAGVTFGDLTITVVESARQLEITIANGGGSDADITTLDVRGVAINFLDPVRVPLLEPVEVQRFLPSPPTWVASISEAEAFNESIVGDLNPPAQTLEIIQHPRRAADADLATLLELDLSDRVTVVADGTITNLGVNGAFHIEAIEHRWVHGAGYTMTLRVSAADPVIGWILGDATFSELGITTVLTY